jgi:hypothetical protein
VPWDFDGGMGFMDFLGISHGFAMICHDFVGVHRLLPGKLGMGMGLISFLFFFSDAIFRGVSWWMGLPGNLNGSN